MILVDTSVWVDHLRSANKVLIELMNAKRVLVHPFIIGELALGSMKRRADVINDLQALPRVTTAEDHEVMYLIELAQLYGGGIGYVDAHLLASCRLSAGSKLWTTDRRLAAAAAKLSLSANPLH